jgi:hypothetical protein
MPDMAADDPIEPIHPDAPSRVRPLDLEGARAARPAPPTPPPATHELAVPLERSLIADADLPDEPASVEQRAAIHDAAVHGDAYARAVEDAARESARTDDAQYPDPNSIGQVLGGAAAAAYSGQAAQIDRTRIRRDERTEHAEDVTSELDALAPTPRVSDDDTEDR